MTLHIFTLGGLEIKREQTAVSGFVSRKAEALFVYLACHPQPISRSILATLLWNDLSSERSLGNLSVLLNSLRKQLGEYLLVSRNEISFRHDLPHQLDVQTFEEKLTAVRPGFSIQSSHQATQLAQAIELYRGEFLAGFAIKEAAGFDEWLLLERERLAQKAITAVSQLMAHHKTEQQHTISLEYGRQLLQFDPLHEETHRQLMQLYLVLGQRHAALEQFENCRRILETELGVEPDEETLALYQEIKTGTSTNPPTALPTRLPTPVLVPAHNLPTQTTPFVGREAELDHLRHRLTDPSCRLITLLGLGGSGKTRLGLQVAAEQLERFPHGVWLVPISGVHSADTFVSAVLQALNIEAVGQPDPAALLTDYLRHKQLLLLLDSFEHYLDGAEQIVHWLQTAAQLTILVTSRERLNIQAEWILHVEGLLYPTTSLSVTAMRQYEAIQLFLQKAQQVEPTFNLSQETQPALVRICQMVGGMPLALELAAANVRYYHCQEIADSIASNLDFLEATARDTPARHRSLRAVFDTSWQLLSAAEQQLFSKVAVFPGSFSREAARAVTHTPLGVLNRLVDKSLVRRNENGRYELHEVLRQYALEKLAQLPEQQGVCETFVLYVARFLQERVKRVSSNQQKTTFAEISAELKNIQAAWDWACDSGHKSLLLELADGLETVSVFWEVRSQYAEAERTFARATAVLAQGHPSEAERNALANLLARQSWMCFRLGQFEAATQHLQHSLTLQPAPHAPSEQAYRFLFQGAIAFGTGQLAEAQQLFQQSYQVYEAAQDEWGMVGTLNNLGQMAMILGNYEEANRLLQKGLRVGRAAHLANFITHILHNLGSLMLTLGQHETAMLYLQESLTLATELGDHSIIALDLVYLGKTAVARQQYREAENLFHQALTVLEEIGERLNIANTLNALGQVALQQKKWQAAEQWLQKTLKLAWDIQALSVVVSGLVGLSAVFAHTHRPTEALTILYTCQPHPAAEQETKEQITQLLATLTPQLPADKITTLPQTPTPLETLLSQLLP